MSQIKLEDIYKELKKIGSKMATKEEIVALTDTFEILSNPETKENIRKSEADIKAGRIKKIRSVKDLLEE